jgi:hypothetical protein
LPLSGQSQRAHLDHLRPLARKGKVETFQASEIAVPDRAAIIAAYRKVCGRTMNPCFTKLPDPSDHPVFRVDEIGAPSRA